MPETSFPRALILVARVFLPIAALTVLGLIGLHLLYLRYPSRTDLMRNLVVDYSMVSEQVDRVASRPLAEIAFLGDSSCLMGIDPPYMERMLNRSVESFCTVAYAGPAGYAAMLEQMIERGATPKVLILMFHPVAFRPDPTWTFWTDLVRNKGRINMMPLEFPRSALDFLAFELVTRFLYSPLPGGYGIYYGSEGEVRSTIRSRHGAAIDPGNGLDISSIDALHASPTNPSGPAVDFSLNQMYRDALATLAVALKKTAHNTQVYLAISPVPDTAFHDGSELQRIESAKEIAGALGIPADHILNTSGAMYAAYFSSPTTHLNRWGKIVFTDNLVKVTSRLH